MKWREVYLGVSDDPQKKCPHQLLTTPRRLGTIIQCSKCKVFFHSVGAVYNNRTQSWETFAWVEGCNHPEDVKNDWTDGFTGYTECGVCGETR